jgi:hypothetical protein
MYKLNEIAKQYSMKISTHKTKALAHKGKDTVRGKFQYVTK